MEYHRLLCIAVQDKTYGLTSKSNIYIVLNQSLNLTKFVWYRFVINTSNIVDCDIFILDLDIKLYLQA